MRCQASPSARVNRQSVGPPGPFSRAHAPTRGGSPSVDPRYGAKACARAPSAYSFRTAENAGVPSSTRPSARAATRFTSAGAASSTADAGPERDLLHRQRRQPPRQSRAPGRVAGEGQQIHADPHRPGDVSGRDPLPEPQRPELPRVRENGPASRPARGRRHVERAQARRRSRLGRVRRPEQGGERARGCLELAPARRPRATRRAALRLAPPGRAPRRPRRPPARPERPRAPRRARRTSRVPAARRAAAEESAPAHGPRGRGGARGPDRRSRCARPACPRAPPARPPRARVPPAANVPAARASGRRTLPDRAAAGRACTRRQNRGPARRVHRTPRAGPLCPVRALTRDAVPGCRSSGFRRSSVRAAASPAAAAAAPARPRTA